MSKTYYELDVWNKSRELVNFVYDLTKNFPKEEQYVLVNQIRRCSISIPSNIAEGCGRQTPKDSINFFYIARGSLYELETQLYLSFDQKYISQEILNECFTRITSCKQLINGFINYYKTQIK
jgi:four helix bundle protein